MSEILNFYIMLYIDLVSTHSSEELWFNYKKHFWQGAIATLERMTYEEFEKALRDFVEHGDHSVFEWVELNDYFWFTEDEEWECIIGRKLWED